MIPIEPQEMQISNHTFRLSKVPATVGREIFTQYIPTALPKIGQYSENEKLMYKLISYVAIKTANGDWVDLKNSGIIDAHISWETLLRLEAAMTEYNCSFFQNGRVSTLLEDFVQKAQAWISKTLTVSSAQS